MCCNRMQRYVLIGWLLSAVMLVHDVARAQNAGAGNAQAPAGPQTTPPWAYMVAAPAAAAPSASPAATPAPAPAAQDPGPPKTLPGSSASFATAQVRDAFNVADWHPGDHPAMPPIVKNSSALVAQGAVPSPHNPDIHWLQERATRKIAR